MAKSKRGRSADVDDNESDNQVEDLPKIKRPKNVRVSNETTTCKNDKGEPYWELSSKRRITITRFEYGKAKDTVRFLDIREFYEKDKQHLPGKKGISLTIEQFDALLNLIPSITAALSAEGETIEGSKKGVIGANDEFLEMAPKRTKPKQEKSNFEATSDEDEDEG